jgi:Ca-activated chloride channel family protein
MKRIVVVVLLAVFAACSVAHQNSMEVVGTIEGHAFYSGAPLPGTTVTLVLRHGVTRVAVTGADGSYRFENVPAGRHKIRFELEGFITERWSVAIAAGKTAQVDGTIRMSAVAEAITVTAAAPGYPAYVTGAVSGGVPSPPNAGGSYGLSYDSAWLGKNKPAATYSHDAENGFIDAKAQAVTTFSIDVDRASYANVRRFLREGQQPPPDAVRIEEMINYFSYSYPQPSGRDPFSITTEVSGCPWNAAHRLVRIGIQGRNLDEWKMAPNNLVFLLDVSGSMSPPDRLPLIVSAFRLLAERLRAEDTVAIVVYAGAAGLVLPPTSGADKPAILAALTRLHAGGSTAGSAGIELAYKTALDNFRKDGNNRVILATDGDFNVGTANVDELQKLIEEKRQSGVFLTTIGVGNDNYRDDVLERLADKGNGNYAYLDDMKEAEKVFKTELTGTLVTIAKDVKVQVEFDPSRVASYRQIGYENRALANRDFEDDTKDAGELGAGHSVTALYEIVPTAAGMNGAMAAVKLRYKEPAGETSLLVTGTVDDKGVSAYAASADMQFAAAVAELGMLLRHSAHKGTATYADVAALARVSTGADLDGYRQELLRMVDTSRALSGEGGLAAKQ